MRYPLALALPMIFTLLTGCASERHFARDSLWPFGNPNAPDIHGENAERALGQAPDVTPIAPQAGNVWPGQVQPVPTIADIEKNMNTPLGQDYTPSLPSPYPPGQQPPPDPDNLDSYTVPPTGIAPDDVTPGAVVPGTNVPSAAVPALVSPNATVPNAVPPGTPGGPENPNADLQLVPGNPHARE